MKAPALPYDEDQRLDALRTLRALDTPVEERFERITRLAQAFFGVTVAAITLVDEERQWFKSARGLEIRQTERRISFCGHALLEDAMLVIEDAAADPRFADNPLVTGPPFIRFYAGIPLRGRNRQPIGTLCIIDHQPRSANEIDFQALKDLAALAEREFTFDSPANRPAGPGVRGGAKVNLLDEVTGLWNWDGIIRQLEESVHRIKLIGGQLTLVWLRMGTPPSDDANAENLNQMQRLWAERLLAGLDFFDTAGIISERDFLLLINEGDRAELMVRLGMVASQLSQTPDQASSKPAHLALAAIKSIDGRMGLATILEKLEAALPTEQQASGTLALLDNEQRSTVSLL